MSHPGMIATNQKSRRKNVVINFEIKLENAADNLRIESKG